MPSTQTVATTDSTPSTTRSMSTVEVKNSQKVAHTLVRTVRSIRPILNDTLQLTRNSTFELLEQAVVKEVPAKVFHKLSEEFNSLRMDYEYDTGETFIVKCAGEEHQRVVTEISNQLRIFAMTSNLTFEACGASINITYQSGENVRRTRSVDPDTALIFLTLGQSVPRIICEFEVGNRSLYILDERIRFMMHGWDECKIGIGCKFFEQSRRDGHLVALMLLYYKRQSGIQLDKMMDIGTRAPRQNQHDRVVERLGCPIDSPSDYQRCRIQNELLSDGSHDRFLVSSDPSFYQVRINTRVIYSGAVVSRGPHHMLTINFFLHFRAFQSVPIAYESDYVDLVANVGCMI